MTIIASLIAAAIGFMLITWAAAMFDCSFSHQNFHAMCAGEVVIYNTPQRPIAPPVEDDLAWLKWVVDTLAAEVAEEEPIEEEEVFTTDGDLFASLDVNDDDEEDFLYFIADDERPLHWLSIDLEAHGIDFSSMDLTNGDCVVFIDSVELHSVDVDVVEFSDACNRWSIEINLVMDVSDDVVMLANTRDGLAQDTILESTEQRTVVLIDGLDDESWLAGFVAEVLTDPNELEVGSDEATFFEPTVWEEDDEDWERISYGPTEVDLML